MELVPFNKIYKVPRYPENSPIQVFTDISKNTDLVDIADYFSINSMRGIRASKRIGVIAYIFGSNLKVEFKKDYYIATVEFRIPYAPFDESGLYYGGINLFNNNMKFVWDELRRNNIPTEITDVGFAAPSIGVYFFSSNFDKNLDVKLDAVTVFFVNF
ncbi:hypothetical protein SXCC_01889 [Gluconacetobacter sp. SXCC-1]|uniref:hypothetical protein n=1 Tax=Komagataeibacter rhaeticus TaxID=215221 RepID=UPI0002080609|nr:hypothetical protein [Komagataeibacter rhaeticus]EGG77499.1 hypothetical protein SXCC_01889 [Gluconacetobacter sp. SXCC-1]WPP23176.1 hypothetical protein SCD25_06810 [Komagataeibacter rhaeticus]